MKKIFAGLLVAVFALISVVNVSAMTETQLRNKIKSGITVNGTTITIPNEYLVQLDNYLADFDISSADSDYIASQIEVLKAAAKDNNVTSFADFEKKCSSTIKSVAANITANTGVKLTVLSNGKLQVSKYNSTEVWAVVDSKIVTNTNSGSILYVAGLISILGAALLVLRVRNA